MLIGRVVISPVSRLRYTIEYPWLEDTEIVTAINTVVVTPADAVFKADTFQIDVDGKKITFFASCDGDDTTIGTTYNVEIVVSTNQLQTSDDCVSFTIDESC